MEGVGIKLADPIPSPFLSYFDLKLSQGYMLDPFHQELAMLGRTTFGRISKPAMFTSGFDVLFDKSYMQVYEN